MPVINLQSHTETREVPGSPISPIRLVAVNRILCGTAVVAPTQEFVGSVVEYGILCPLLVRAAPAVDPAHDFIVVDGRRRLLAAERAGITEVPVQVLSVAETETLPSEVRAAILNTQRTQNYLTEADAILTLRGRGLDNAHIATVLNMSPATIRRRVRLAGLNSHFREALQLGQISQRTAMRLAGQPVGHQRDIAQVFLNRLREGLRPFFLPSWLGPSNRRAAPPETTFEFSRRRSTRTGETVITVTAVRGGLIIGHTDYRIPETTVSVQLTQEYDPARARTVIQAQVHRDDGVLVASASHTISDAEMLALNAPVRRAAAPVRRTGPVTIRDLQEEHSWAAMHAFLNHAHLMAPQEVSDRADRLEELMTELRNLTNPDA